MSKTPYQAVDVYLEKHKTRGYVGRLSKEGKHFVFRYSEAYRNSNCPVSLGPDLPLKKQKHRSLNLFPSLADKIPSKANPAYQDYCRMAGITPFETDPFTLLVALGKKGPSSFVCVPVSKNTNFGAEDLKQFRKSLNLSLREFASLFDVSTASLYRVENKKSDGKNILKKIADYYHSPHLTRDKIKKTGFKIHEDKKTFVEKALKSQKPLSPFTLTPDDLKKCTPLQATELLRRLMLMECQSFGIPQGSVHIARQICTPDGGQDGLVKWQGGVKYTNYFPRSYNVFQIKAGPMPVSRCKNEILTNNKQLNPALKNALKNKGAYIIGSTHPVSGVHLSVREEALYQALKEQGADVRHLEIKFYDANILTNWINMFPSLVVWFLKEVCQKSFKPWLSYEEWSRTDSSYKHEFMCHKELEQKKDLIYNTLSERGKTLHLTGAFGVGKTRLTLETFRPQPADQKDLSPLVLYADMGEEPLTAQNIRELKNHRLILIIDNCPLEKAESFHQTASREDSQISLLTIDAEGELSSGERLTNAPHAPLVELKPDTLIVQKMLAGSQSITNKWFHPDWVECTQGLPLMVQLLKSTNPLDLLTRPQPSLRKKMLGNQVTREAEKILKACSLFHNICLEDEEHGPLKIITQFPPARTKQEAQYVAEKISGMSLDDFFKHISFLKKRNIIRQFDRFIQVRPKPLSAWLARELISETPPNTLIQWIQGMIDPPPAPLSKKDKRECQKKYNHLSDTQKKEFQREMATHSSLNPLRHAFSKQLSYLKDFSESQKLVKQLVGKTGLFGSEKVLTTQWGAECFAILANIHPQEALNTLKRVFEDMPLKELKTVQNARSSLTGILKDLAFHKELYSDSARLLLRFAETETESFFDNNAKGIFAHHFQVYLSGTEAPPQLKFQIIKEIQNQASLRQKETALKALQTALKTEDFTGFITSAGMKRKKDFQPATYGEVWDYYCQALTLLTHFVTQESEQSLQTQAKQVIAQNLMPLLTLRIKTPTSQIIYSLRSEKLYQCIKKTIDAVTSRSTTPWIQAFQEGERFLNRPCDNELKSKLTTLLQTLKPKDLTYRLRSYVTEGSYYDMHPQHLLAPSASRGKTPHGGGYSPGFLSLVKDFSNHLKKQIEQNDMSCLGILFHGPGNNILSFAGEVARQLKPNTQIMNKLLQYVKNHKNKKDFNPSFLIGFTSEFKKANIHLIDSVLDQMASDKSTAELLPAIYYRLSLQDRDIKRLTGILKKNICPPPNELCHIANGQNCKNVSPKIMANLIKELAGKKPPWAWAGLYLYNYYKDDLTLEKKNTLLPALHLLLAKPGMLKAFPDNNTPTNDTMAGFYYKEAMKDILNTTNKPSCGKQPIKVFLSEILDSKIPLDDFAIAEEYIRECFATIMKTHPDEALPEILKKYSASQSPTQNPYTHFLINNLFNRERENHPLSSLPEGVIKKWCKKHHKAPAFFARYLNLSLYNPSDKKEQWSALARFLFNNYGDREDVTHSLSLNLSEWSWKGGDLTPFLRQKIKLLEELHSHPHKNLREFVKHTVGYFQDHINRIHQRNQYLEEFE